MASLADDRDGSVSGEIHGIATACTQDSSGGSVSSTTAAEDSLIHDFKYSVLPHSSSTNYCWKPSEQKDWIYGIKEKYPVRNGLNVVFQALINGSGGDSKDLLLPECIRKHHLSEVKETMKRRRNKWNFIKGQSS